MKIEKVIDQKDSYLVNDTKYVPKVEGNTDYKSVLEWVSNGGQVVEFDYLKQAKEEKVNKCRQDTDTLITSKYSKTDQLNILMSGDNVRIAEMNSYIEPILAISRDIRAKISHKGCDTLDKLNKIDINL